jgi:hypothetical protein
MYDNDAVTLVREQVGSGTYTFLPAGSVRYIVGLAVQQSGVASDTLIKCGNNTILRNYGKENNFQQVSIKCNDAISLDKTGNDSAFVTVTYIPRDLSLLPPSQTSISSTSGNLVELGLNSRVGMQGLAFIIFIGLAILILFESFRFGIWFFKRDI